MASNLLTPMQLEEIRERANEQIREGGSEAGEAFAGDVLDLLAALDAATAEVERMRKAAQRAIHSSRGVDHDFNSAGRREYEAAISELHTALEARP